MFLKVQKRFQDKPHQWYMFEVKSLSWVKEKISDIPQCLSNSDKKNNRSIPLEDIDCIGDGINDEGYCFRIMTKNLINNTSIIWTQEFYIMNGEGKTVDYYSL